MSQTTLFRNYRRSRLFIAVAFVFGATAFGAIGFWLIEGWNIIDSLYMTVFNPTGDFVFEPGDIVFAIGSDEALDHLRIRASGQSPEL
jgi:hypothetical protein